jgi:hypothetical protein
VSGHAGFGWTLLVLGLVIAGFGLGWILAASLPWLGSRRLSSPFGAKGLPGVPMVRKLHPTSGGTSFARQEKPP